MTEMVEHQATVDTGLKMKIKRKNPLAKSSSSSSSSSCEAAKCKATATSAEDKNGNLKSGRKARPDPTNDSSGNDATSSSSSLPPDGKPRAESAGLEPAERPQKRRRNAKSVGQARSQNGKDPETTKGIKPAKAELESHRANSSANSPKQKPKNPKAAPTSSEKTSPAEKEKPSRKRSAPFGLPPSSSNNASETTKPKPSRLGTGSDNKEAVEDKMVDLRKTGFNIKSDVDECQKKMDLKAQVPQDCPSPLNCLSSTDPYEFVAKFEDTAIQTPVKKFKSDKSEGVTADQTSGTGTGTGRQDASTETCTVGVTTDPDCLGPCEPGTSVVLEGIVWSESNNGILVVNVTWRGKTYVGTLMDTTKHNWASPRFCEESPVPDLDWRLPKSKRSCATPVTEVLEGRRLRKCRRNVAPSNSCTNSRAAPQSSLRQSPVPNDASVLGRRKGRTMENLESSSSLAPSSSSSSSSTSSSSSSSQGLKRSGDGDGTLPGSEVLLECNGVNCKKKFRHISGLNYHQSHAHRKSLAVEILPESGAKVALPSAAVVVVVHDPPEGGMEVQGVEGELVSAISENAGDRDPARNVDAHGLLSDVATDVAKSTAENLELSETGILPTAMSPLTSSSALSQTSADAARHPVDEIRNSDSNAFSPREDVAKPHLHGTGKQGAALRGKVSDAKEEESTATTMLPVSSSCDADKVRPPDAGTHDPSNLCPRSSNVSCLKPLPLICSTEDGAFENHVASSSSAEPLSESTAVETVRNLPGSGVSSVQRSPANPDIISEPRDVVGVATGHEMKRIHGKESETKKQLKPTETRQHHHHQQQHHHQYKTKQEASGNSHSSSSATHSIHRSSSSHDVVLEPTTKETEMLRKKESGVSPADSFAKPLPSEDAKRVAKREIVDTEGLQAREPRPCQDPATSRHGSTTSAAAVTPTVSRCTASYNCASDHSTYHLQVLGQSSETRSHYERWLMEHGHQYLQQQRCFNRLMHAEDEGCSTSDSKPVDMSSKSQATADRSGQSVPKPPAPPPPSARHPDIPPPPTITTTTATTTRTGSGNSCSDNTRNPSVEKPSGLREKPENARRNSHRHRDTVKDRSDRTAVSAHRTSSRPGLNHNNSASSPDRSDTCPTTATVTAPVSRSLNPVGNNMSPYVSSGYLKNFVPDPRHPSLIGYGQDVSYIDWSVGGSLNSKLLDLDSKQVVSGSDRRRPTGDPQQHALDVLRFQSTMYGKPDFDQKFDQANNLREFVEKDSSHPGKNNTAAAQRENSELLDHNNSPLTLRHLHTHHHTHLVGAAYPIYGSYSGLMSPVPAMVPPVPPVIPPTYLPK